MKILVNGESAETRDVQTVEELVHKYQLQPETTLIEHNGVALRRREWMKRTLNEGDRIEILRVAAGG
jgi:thiamine biosynthesis protein ThiS